MLENEPVSEASSSIFVFKGLCEILWNRDFIVQCGVQFLAEGDALSKNLTSGIIVDSHILFDQTNCQFWD